MWPYYKLLPNLPRPPQKFFDAVDISKTELPLDTDVHDVRIRYATRGNEKFMASPSVRLPFNEEWEQWVRENIVPNFNETGVNWRHANSDTSGIHTDTTRDYTLSYNITNGGPNCRVVYWQEEGQPVMRTHAIQHLNFDNVKKIFELPVGPDNVWFIHETRILHSAEGIEHPRIQFQVSLNEKDVPAEWFN
jgi:hypothetical protein